MGERLRDGSDPFFFKPLEGAGVPEQKDLKIHVIPEAPQEKQRIETENGGYMDEAWRANLSDSDKQTQLVLRQKEIFKEYFRRLHIGDDEIAAQAAFILGLKDEVRTLAFFKNDLIRKFYELKDPQEIAKRKASIQPFEDMYQQVFEGNVKGPGAEGPKSEHRPPVTVFSREDLSNLERDHRGSRTKRELLRLSVLHNVYKKLNITSEEDMVIVRDYLASDINAIVGMKMKIDNKIDADPELKAYKDRANHKTDQVAVAKDEDLKVAKYTGTTQLPYQRSNGDSLNGYKSPHYSR